MYVVMYVLYAHQIQRVPTEYVSQPLNFNARFRNNFQGFNETLRYIGHPSLILDDQVKLKIWEAPHPLTA